MENKRIAIRFVSQGKDLIFLTFKYFVYGAYNHISQNRFERCDFHVTWNAFVLPNSHFRTMRLFSCFLFEKLITCLVLPISQFLIVRRFTNFTNSDPFWLEFVKLVKRRTIRNCGIGKTKHVISFSKRKQEKKLMVRKCEFGETNAFQVTWKSHLSNWFCEIWL